MADPAEQRRQEPVFRLVRDTTTFTQADRFLLDVRVGLLIEFGLVEAVRRHNASTNWSEN